MPTLHALVRRFGVRPPRPGVIAALGLWLLAIGAGFRVLVDYELTPGTAQSGPVRWPKAAGLTLNADRMNLVMFAHPQCPCSRASVRELEVIMTRCAAQVQATVCFIDFEGQPDTWARSDLWEAASAIPGVKVVADRGGRIASQFGSVTSGQVLVFDGAGRQRFSGGITGARGHAGDNRGRQQVIALARGELGEAGATAVYGCSLAETTVAAPRRFP